jgi:hypothetical protein
MKILPMGADLFRAGERTDGHDKPNRRFSQFCKRALKMRHMKSVDRPCVSHLINRYFHVLSGGGFNTAASFQTLYSVLHSTDVIVNFTKLHIGFTSSSLLESTVKVSEDFI